MDIHQYKSLKILLKRAGQEWNLNYLEQLTKYCDICQRNQKSPGRFKFTLRDDIEFNYSLFMDVLWIEGLATLQVADEATRFQAARFLKSMSTKDLWEAIRNCCIDVYIRPPDVISHDAGKILVSAEFKQNAAAMAIRVNEASVEAHNSI